MISQSRWDKVLSEVGCCLEDCKGDYSITKLEISLIMSVLKNNTPFQVVPDCCLGKTPNKETIEAMGDDVILEENIVVLETNNVLLETQHFKVLGDKE